MKGEMKDGGDASQEGTGNRLWVTLHEVGSPIFGTGLLAGTLQAWALGSLNPLWKGPLPQCGPSDTC